MKVCPQCFDNRTFRRRLEEVRPAVGRGRCDFHPSRKGIPLAAVGGIVDEVFRNNFICTGSDRGAEGEQLKELLRTLTRAVDEAVASALADRLI